MLTIVLLILAAIAVIGTIRNCIIRDELDEREEMLDKFEVHLDERANQLALWEDEIRKKESKK